MSQNVAGLIRDLEARRSALRLLAAAHDRFSEIEQVARLTGDVAEAEGVHWYAIKTLRAYRNEMDNPEPPGIGTLAPYGFVPHRMYGQDRG